MTIREPISIPLHRHPYGLWGVDVELGAETLPFLFDTGAGLTTIQTGLAEQSHLRSEGRLTGFRMTGERVDLGVCADVALSLGGLSIRHEVAGLFDLAAFLPDDFPPLGGVIAANTFTALPVTFDFRHRTLTLESDRSLAERTSKMTPLDVRIGRPLQGIAVEVYVAARRAGATVWLELDTANTGPVLLDTHAARRLGLDLPDGGGVSLTLPSVSLEVATGQLLETEVAVRDLILDGNLGATFIENNAFTLDLRQSRLWIDRAP